MSKIDINDKSITDTVEILKVLAHPIRYSIAKVLLSNGVMNVGAIQDALSLPQSTVSQHISKMRQLGVVDHKREGTKIYYELVNPIAKQIIQQLAE